MVVVTGGSAATGAAATGAGREGAARAVVVGRATVGLEATARGALVVVVVVVGAGAAACGWVSSFGMTMVGAGAGAGAACGTWITGAVVIVGAAVVASCASSGVEPSARNAAIASGAQRVRCDVWVIVKPKTATTRGRFPDRPFRISALG